MAGKFKQEFIEEAMDRQENNRRGYWGNKAEFILASFGNVWGVVLWTRFPIYCYMHGGLPVFLIAKIVMMCHIGIPMMLLEMYLGQYSSQGVLTVWRLCPLFKGIGVSILLYGCLTLSFYAQSVSSAFHYFILSFTQVWFECDNHWNTANCVDRNTLPPPPPNNTSDDYYTYMNQSYAKFERSFPADNYFKNVFKAETANPDFAIDSMAWKRVVYLAVLWAAIALILFFGVRTFGKVVYVTSTLPFLLLTVFVIRSLTLPGSLQGLQYIFLPDFYSLLNPGLWIDAASDVIFGLGIGYGGHLTLASYNRFQNNYVLDAVIIAFVHLLTGVACAVIVFAFAGFLSNEIQVHLDEFLASGDKLIYVIIPEAMSRIPFPPVWCFLFFLLTFNMSFSGFLPLMEVVCTGICDLWRPLLKLRFVFVGISSAVFFLVGILFCTSAGQHMFISFDHHINYFNAAIICAMSTCAVFYTICRIWHDLKLMLGGRHVCFVIMTFLVAIPCCVHWLLLPLTSIFYLVLSARNYEAPTSVVDWAIYVGWATLGLMLLPLVLWPIIIFIRSCCRGCRCSPVFCPDSRWGPHLSRFRAKATHLPHINVYPVASEGLKLQRREPYVR